MGSSSNIFEEPSFDLSVVVPVMNEEDNVGPMIDRIASLLISANPGS
jgi:hypothetical protein